MTEFIKKVLQSLFHSVHGRVRRGRIRRLVDELRGSEPAIESVMPIVSRLREAWGNTGWTADLGVLEAAIGGLFEDHGPILECGAGLSTVVLGALGEGQNAALYSLEQDLEWVERVKTMVQDLELGNVHVIHAPLEEVDGLAWYGFDDHLLPRDIPTVFCDGPAVFKRAWPKSVYLAWREGVVPGLNRRGITFGTIILDDLEDARCNGVVKCWKRAGLEVEMVETPWGGHVIARNPRWARGEAATST